MKGNQRKIGAMLSYFVIGLNMIVGILYTPFLIRKLGQAEYGLYSIVNSVISYLTIMDMGFGNAIIIYTSRYLNQGDKEKQDKLMQIQERLKNLASMTKITQANRTPGLINVTEINSGI